MITAYSKLSEHFNKIHYLHEASSILHWDSATMMPSNSINARSAQLATLAEIAHNLLISDQSRELIDQTQNDSNSLNNWQQKNFDLIKRSYQEAIIIPSALVKAISEASSKCEATWRSARHDNDFKRLIPSLTELLNLTRQYADIKAEFFGLNRYDALLDNFDKGRKSVEIDTIFLELKQFLPSFIDQVIEKQKVSSSITEVKGNFPTNLQYNLSVELMKILGFDFTQGRLDTSHHPFCGGVSGDVRITTRYETDNFLPSLMAIMHETGHALYSMNLPAEYLSQPVGYACGMAVHESQSLLFEMQIGSRPEFINYIYPLITKHLSLSKEITPEAIYRNITRVSSSLIRVNADEVTYPLHIIMRYELEKSLINDELQVQDLPNAWNEKFYQLFNIKVPNDKDGCMQDIHWPSGSFGYFPTYSLGAIIAAQLYKKLETDLVNISEDITQGNFARIIKWLEDNIHSQGSKYSSNKLIEQATGFSLNVEQYKNYLQNKYLT